MDHPRQSLRSVMVNLKVAALVPVLLGLNYVFNEMDDSGLHVSVLTSTLESAKGNASSLHAFRALADLADEMGDPSGASAQWFEITERRKPQDGSVAPMIDVTLVHRTQVDSPQLPQWLANELTLRSTTRLRTVFPEQSRWRVVPTPLEPGRIGRVGRLALLIQQTSYDVDDLAADSFRHLWKDLGVSALGEPGVVRCDLLQSEDEPRTFVSRKVFRDATALEAHEASPQYARWLESIAVAPGLIAHRHERTLMDTLHPRTSVAPFKSDWAT
jgi:quinol monooxygenase YgiN